MTKKDKAKIEIRVVAEFSSREPWSTFARPTLVRPSRRMRATLRLPQLNRMKPLTLSAPSDALDAEVSRMARIPGGLKLAGAGLGLAAVIGFVAWAVDEADERRKRAARAQQFVRDAVAGVAGVLGRPVPVVTFDTGCPNAWTDQRTICFNTAWAVNELTASCGADVSRGIGSSRSSRTSSAT